MIKNLKFALSLAMLAAANTALADPGPGNPKLPAPVGVFCIQPTRILDIGNGDTRITFEMVNWTYELKDDLILSLLRGPNQTPLGTMTVGAGFTSDNDWASPRLVNTISAEYTTGVTGTPIANFDLPSPFLNPFNPNAPDSGINTQRGFEVTVNGWDPSERLAFSWIMFGSGQLDPDGFDRGVWAMDRSSDPYSAGSLVRATTWEQPNPNANNGFDPIDFVNNPLDPQLTDQNAVTFNIPEPCSAMLLAGGLLLFGSSRRKLLI